MAGFCHNDIKPDNIMVYKGADGLPAAKLIDLGFFTKVSNSLPLELIGTQIFMALEELYQLPCKDCHATDVFATGLSLF